MKATASLTFHLRGLWTDLPFHGLRVPVKGDHITKPVWKGIWRKSYEAPELLALQSLIRPDDRILELGAGMGLVSGVVAKRFPNAQFVSYEANPHLAPIIRNLHRRNGISNVTLHSAVVAPTASGDMRQFRIHRNFTESSLVTNSADMYSVDVPVHDPVDVMEQVKPDMLLCDIEGGEAELIPALPLAGVRAVVIELHPNILSRHEMSRIFDAFLTASLVPVVELSTATVMAFERVESGQS